MGLGYRVVGFVGFTGVAGFIGFIGFVGFIGVLGFIVLIGFIGIIRKRRFREERRVSPNRRSRGLRLQGRGVQGLLFFGFRSFGMLPRTSVRDGSYAGGDFVLEGA